LIIARKGIVPVPVLSPPRSRAPVFFNTESRS